MGNFYTNITLRTTDTDRVVDAVRQANRIALITPPDLACTVVFDQASESQDQKVLQRLASHLSAECHCAALAVINHDDDILMYFLYENGKLVDEYNSAPTYFLRHARAKTPKGGNAERLCAAFGVPDQEADIERILRIPPDADSFIFELDRHQKLVDALGLPASAVGTGYTYLEQGELPEGLELSMLRRV
ncbi:MAG TPA: hypothetical protein VK864_13890 [Longimicrobiales bacterium]|nr:hypothetical protein [Longimicrobiales bacterium]